MSNRRYEAAIDAAWDNGYSIEPACSGSDANLSLLMGVR